MGVQVTPSAYPVGGRFGAAFGDVAKTSLRFDPLAFRDELTARRQALIEGLAGIPQLHWTPTGGGFFALVRVAGCTDSAALANDILERAHVVTIPGSIFGASGEGFIRLSYSAVTQEAIGEATCRLRRFFEERRV